MIIMIVNKNKKRSGVIHNMLLTVTDVTTAFAVSADNLNCKKNLLNSLNYFPVADKDTGTNMAISMELVRDNLTECTWPKEVFDNVVDTFINKAHGNSGTILTMFFLGMASALPEGRDIDGRQLAQAYIQGANSAFDCMPNIIDGTILSLMKKTADSCLSSLPELENDPIVVWERICNEAFSILPLTAYQNPTLKQYLLPDSGAAGFCIILDSFRSAFLHLKDTSISYELESILPGEEIENITDWKISTPYQYCFELVVGIPDITSGSELDRISCEIWAGLSNMGDCLIVVPHKNNIKVHIHTNSPTGVVNYVSRYGHILSRKMDDMLSLS